MIPTFSVGEKRVLMEINGLFFIVAKVFGGYGCAHLFIVAVAGAMAFLAVFIVVVDFLALLFGNLLFLVEVLIVSDGSTDILAVGAAASITAFDTSGVALTVFLKAARFLAMATL